MGHTRRGTYPNSADGDADDVSRPTAVSALECVCDIFAIHSMVVEGSHSS